MGMTIRKKEVVKYRDEEHKVPLVLYEIIVDRVGELPANHIVEGEEIAQGSRCWVIESAIWYGYTSTGKWINQKDGGAAPVLIEKTITENGTYDASADNADGYSKVTVDVAGGGGETFEVEVEFTVTTDTAPIAIVNKTYQQIKSEIDLGKTISGTIRVTYNSLVSSGELSISYVKDFYYGTKIASDAIFIVTEPFLLNLTSKDKMNSIIPVVITPDNKVWLTMTNDWVSNPET